MATTKTLTQSNVLSGSQTLRVTINEPTYQSLVKIADANNKEPEHVAAECLRKFAHVDSTKPIVLSDTQRQHLERLLGRNFTTADELTSAMQRALTIRVNEQPIPIAPFLLDRLTTRCIGMPFDKFLTQTITRLLEEFVGVR